MARFEFKLPDIGEGIAEAEIVAWHVRVGDTVAEDQQLADMMTDKATVEMESPVAGKVLEVAGEVGDMIPIGSVLVVIETTGEAAAAAAAPAATPEEPLADGCQPGVRGDLDVVEPDHRQLPGHVDSEAARRFEHAESLDVRGGEHRSRRLREPE